MSKEHPCNVCDINECDGCIWDQRYSNCCSRIDCEFYRDYCVLGIANECKLSDEYEGY